MAVSSTGERSYADTDGHGTMVAGLAGALDDRRGMMGAAPGARLWAVKASDSSEEVTDAQLVCGLAWVRERAHVIDVAILSYGGYVEELAHTCDHGGIVGDIRRLLCDLEAAGVTVVTSAGNHGASVAMYEPAAYPEVIAVGALVDTDARAGGTGPAPACEDGERDGRDTGGDGETTSDE